MIVTCPECSKRYMLDDALVSAEGRQVRCISCRHVWKQTREIPSFLNEGPPLDSYGYNPERKPLNKAPKGFGRSLFFLSLILLIMGGSLVFTRNFVVSIWPESERAYELLGLSISVPGKGLQITEATSTSHVQEGEEVIVVTGDVVNITSRVRTIPPLKILFMAEDPQGKPYPLDIWEHRLSESTLLPGEKIHFETAPRPNVKNAHHIHVEF